MAAGKKAGRHSQQSNDFLEPKAPTSVSAVDIGTGRAYNNGAATVTFTHDSSGPAATSYTATSSPGGYTGTGSSSPLTVGGLQSSTGYTFTVIATNAVGNSPASSASGSITATTVPATPGAPTASTPSAGTDRLTWTAPANGGKAITNYFWASSDSKSGNTASTTVDISQEQGTAQTYTVRADNANGSSGTSSASNSITTTFSFVPFGVFGFSPFGVFGFSPFGFAPYCVDQDTPISIVGPNDSIAFKSAEDINVGDEVWAMVYDEYVDEEQGVAINSFSSPELTNKRMEKTIIQSILPSTKTQTIYFNNDINKRFSLQENILIKRNSMFAFVESGQIQIGDIYVNHNEDGTFSDTVIDAITVIDENRTVYKFNAEPIDHITAGGMVVHNVKD
jgi:hypothetical protein